MDFTSIKYSGQGRFTEKKGTIEKLLFYTENRRHLPIASVNDPLSFSSQVLCRRHYISMY